MENYERRIGLKTIYLTFVRRFIYMIIIFVPIALVSFLVTNYGIKKTYQSSAQVTKNAAFVYNTTYSTYSLIVSNPETATTAANNLQTAGKTHKNGSAITVDEINTGLSMPTWSSSTSNSIIATIYYQSTDSSITKFVLEEVVKVANEKALAKSATDFAGLTSQGTPSDPKVNSNGTKYFLIALAAGAVLAIGVPFVYEIVADEVYDKEDIELMGSEGFNLKLSK